MNFRQLVLHRYSCRNYQKKALPLEVVNELFETCRFAPSAANYQPWQFIIVNQAEILEKIYLSYTRPWIKTAPTIIIALADNSKAWIRNDGKNHSNIDLAIFIDHFTLAATEKELATCWICNFDVVQIQKEFSLPANIEPVALISVGYSAEGIKVEKKRKETDEFVYFNSYKNDRI